MSHEIFGPLDRGSNDFGVRFFTATTTSQAHALPREWQGRYVVMRADGADVHYGFSPNPSAAIDSGVAATAAGASAGAGGIIPDGTSFETHRVVPRVVAGGDIYFVREVASDSATVRIELADTIGAKN